MIPSARNFKFSIDRGGTFTDVYCHIENGNGTYKNRVLKLLSEDPLNYNDAPTEGIRRILEQETGKDYPKNMPVCTDRIEYIRMGTTVATNSLLERKGERCALLTTKGFGDLQRIGNQSRPKIFDLRIIRPDILYEVAFEVDERVILDRSDIKNEFDESKIRLGLTDEKIYIEKEVSEEEIVGYLQQIRDMGIRSIAIVLLHSYIFPDHELFIYNLAKKMNCFDQISLSSEVMPTVRLVPRGCTTCVDAYLTPIINRYLQSFTAGFDSNLTNDRVSFMQSDGGLTPMDRFKGNRAILSGPAGGVVGYAMTSYVTGEAPIIGFDMGGTSTDVSRYAGAYEHVFESVTAGVTICSPQLDINTVAAGGGSRLFFRGGIFVVGPDSAGAHPGPVCYRKGGPLTVTDANLVLGRLQPQMFPAIFGPSETERLDVQGSLAAMQELTDTINLETNKNYSVEEVAFSFITVANEAMARPIRNLTTMKGHDVTKHILATFGGAGPQHCGALAKSLGIQQILVHRYAGILSAYGLSLADLVVEKQEPYSGILSPSVLERVVPRLQVLEESAREVLYSQGFSKGSSSASSIRCLRYLALRYLGTDTSLMITLDEEGGRGKESSAGVVAGAGAGDAESYVNAFVTAYKREFGFVLSNRSIVIDDIRVRAIGMSSSTSSSSSSSNSSETGSSSQVVRCDSFLVLHRDRAVPRDIVPVYFEGGWVQRTPLYLTQELRPGDVVDGPALIIQDIATVVLEPYCSCTVTQCGDLFLTVKRQSERVHHDLSLDPLMLSLFSHRFMGIAEQMGRTLQRTSVSVNIKERLDFSCALFDAEGGLVANAPHLPVHLGAMSDAVKYQLRHWGADIHDGDVFLSNHPHLAGGSHLPDITVITPVFREGKIVFFVAARGHHADVGGISPGSMPSMSKTLSQEGIAIISFKILNSGVFQEEDITKILLEPGTESSCSGTRLLADNISDLKAQIAANSRGVALMQDLMDVYSLAVVTVYMKYIQDSAEASVRSTLKSFARDKLRATPTPCDANNNIVKVSASDYLDDGSVIHLEVTIDAETGSAVFDFEGTGPEVYGNLNAPPAVTFSAIMYCMRCLLTDMDIPLNQGCMTPIEVKIPKGCLLNPSVTAAVVGGNVLTSQRVTDVVFLAFAACAASQGCMNNLTFGDESFGYYETIAGGAGAGPGWRGASGVHTHMTNTRITDPEILERRYPVLLRRFGLRPGSGGEGLYDGGDGVIRELEFRKPLDVSVLCERRAFQPYGLAGGGPGARGLNILGKRDSGAAGGRRRISLGGKNSLRTEAGDVLTLFTPGGGGYGPKRSRGGTTEEIDNQQAISLPTGSGGSLLNYTLLQESA